MTGKNNSNIDNAIYVLIIVFECLNPPKKVKIFNRVWYFMCLFCWQKERKKERYESTIVLILVVQVKGRLHFCFLSVLVGQLKKKQKIIKSLFIKNCNILLLTNFNGNKPAAQRDCCHYWWSLRAIRSGKELKTAYLKNIAFES